MGPLSAPLQLATESIQGRRGYNEDACHADALPDGRLLLAVADGMGGHAAGEVASALAIEVLREALASGSELGAACALANARVHALARSDPGKKGMGTTLVAVLADGARYLVANVGDSRAYLLDGGGVRQLTEDHSFLAEALRRGQSEEEARSSPWKDALTRSIGIDADVKVDVFGPFELQGDSAVLLCSDGLFKALSDRDLGAAFAASADVRDAATRLVQAAYDAGSDDNITVVVAERGRVPRGAASATPPKRAAKTLEFDEPFQPPAEEPVEAAPPTPPATARGSSGWKLVLALAAVAAVAAALALLRD